MPVAAFVSVNPRLPALLGASGWRAVTGDRRVVALPGAATEAAMLRAAGVACVAQ